MAAVERAYPDASEEEIKILFAAHCYGEELAARLEADMARRKR